ncbi:hypothetical protein ACFWBG_24515 [Nocardia salmonicida]|uniref:hypothetical protein n=1 Tax=Nocardia salmonicida TaxID=53431 RepID=UPI00366AE418
MKNSRGHLLIEHGIWRKGKPDFAFFTAIESLTNSRRAEFECVSQTLLPEVGTRLSGRIIQGTDLVNGWVVVQGGSYRYVVDVDDDSARVRMVVSEYLAAEVLWFPGESGGL